MTLKKLPIGIQSFSTVRQDDFIYIDKTEMVHQLASTQGRFFLSRPRRFGKSMLISTFHDLFEGKKSLFEGLYIYDKWDWNTTYPVIRIDFAGASIRNQADLNHSVLLILKYHQEQFAIACEEKNAVDFISLIIFQKR